MSFASTLLVPVDFSSKSEIAVRYACEIARTTGAEVLFLNVIDPPYDFPSRVEELVEAKKEENAAKLERLIDDLHSAEDFRFVKMKGQVELGKVGPVLLETAQSRKYDLIVVGLGGEPDLKKALYGSITNNLLLESPIPVFAISKRIDYRAPRHLIFATDLRDGDLKPIKRMKKFALELGVSFRLVHIIENKNDEEQNAVRIFEQQVCKKLKEPSLEIEIYEGTSYLEEMTKLIGHDKETILVMTRYKKKFLEWLFSSSTVRVLAQIAEVPLLLLPNDQD